MLVKALARYFDAKLLLLDVTDFSLKVSSWAEILLLCMLLLNLLVVGFWQIQSKYGTSSKGSVSFPKKFHHMLLLPVNNCMHTYTYIYVQAWIYDDCSRYLTSSYSLSKGPLQRQPWRACLVYLDHFLLSFHQGKKPKVWCKFCLLLQFFLSLILVVPSPSGQTLKLSLS